tara:strand:+ start:194 stop:493 length:300 start_codon:yes stop_codon:yes gene_type:complete
MYPNKPKQKKKVSNSEIKIAQLQYVVGEVTKRLQGLIYGFDSYVKMKGDDESLNNFIKENLENRKNEATKENTKDESTRDDSKSSNTKPVGTVSQDTAS